MFCVDQSYCPLRFEIPDSKESSRPSKPTLSTIKQAEQLLFCLDLVKGEREKAQEYKLALEELKRRKKAGKASPSETLPAPIPSPYLLGKSPSLFLLESMARIKQADMEESLLVLPFSEVLILFEYVTEWIEHGKAVEMVTRVVSFLLKLHQSHLVTSGSLQPILTKLSEATRRELGKLKSLMGYNRAGMDVILRRVRQESTTEYFGDDQGVKE